MNPNVSRVAPAGECSACHREFPESMLTPISSSRSHVCLTCVLEALAIMRTEDLAGVDH